MLQSYTANEFYADLLSYRLMRAKRRWDKVFFYVTAGIFTVTWIALFWRREEVNGYINRFEGKFVEWVFADPAGRSLLIGIAGLFFLLNVGPTLTYYARKYWIFPKSSLSLQAYLSVLSTESIKLPRGRNSQSSPRAYYANVKHPVSGKTIPVEISEDWYKELNASHQVHARYHPSSDNVLYLVKH